MRIRLLTVLFIGIFLLLPFGLAQTTASLDSIPARMHDVIGANEIPGAVTVVATYLLERDLVREAAYYLRRRTADSPAAS